MNDINQVLSEIECGDPEAADRLLPLVYRELRVLAGHLLARERPGQTLEATALVHEAYLRLVGDRNSPGSWDGRHHFFAAAAEAMRRLLVENARRKTRLKHGGNLHRVELGEEAIPVESPVEDILAFDEALEQLSLVDPEAAALVKLKRFSGLTTEEAAECLGVSARAAYRTWAFARAWLFRHLHTDDEPPPP
jgi:RNA polymerase sigma factor (TIGR02999 family)